MPYLIQAEEREIPYDLMQQLAEVIADSPGLIRADGMHEVRAGHGILHVRDQAEADRLSALFGTLGVPVFLLEELLPLPPPEPLDLSRPWLHGAAEVVTMAALEVVHERVVMGIISPFRIRMTGSGGIVAGLDRSDYTVEGHTTRYDLDLLTRTQHWRAQAGTLAPIETVLRAMDLSGAAVGRSVQSLLAGRHNFHSFASEAEYDRHVTWLYQVKYAPR